ncbi:hypothetical protein POSPLADRAFT_1135288, partial [Postia placenta MAD-698-R-SB12]
MAAHGPSSRYNEETIPENDDIRRFVWEYAHVVYELFSRLEHSGITASGTKIVLATPALDVLGAIASEEGLQLHHGLVNKVLKW